jgi:hypothetical protein
MTAHVVLEYPHFSDSSPNGQGRVCPGLAQGEYVVLISEILCPYSALYTKPVLLPGAK